MATRTFKGWVPKDEDNEEMIKRFNKEGKYFAVFSHKEDAEEHCFTSVKQVEITITCKDVKEKKK